MEIDWEKVLQVFLIISSKLAQRDVCALASVNSIIRRCLLSHAPLWKVLDLHGATGAGWRLAAAIALSRFDHLEEINFEFAQGLEDKDLQWLEKRKSIERINLNGCQKITDTGLTVVARSCPNLESFSIYWNLRVTDSGFEALLKNCSKLTKLNLSGCKGVTNKSLEIMSMHGTHLKELNLTRCLKLTDYGLAHLLESCRNIEVLYLYALSNFTEKSYVKLGNLKALRVLDLCGAQNLTDDGISQGLANCKELESLNMTWCVKVTDRGIQAIAQNCSTLELLSLHGILGVTDAGLVSLSHSCSERLTTIDVNGCANIKNRSHADLLRLFPNLRHFNVHS